MNPRVIDAVLVALVAFVGLWIQASAQALPAVVASHFGAGGVADGRSTRASYVALMLLAGCVLPLLLAYALPPLLRALGGAGLNVPNRAYWTAPERLGATLAWTGSHLRWVALLTALFIAGLHRLVIEAHRSTPPRLVHAHLMLLVVPFVAAMALWSFVLWRHFRLPR